MIKQNWTEIRRFMWNYVGIVRTTKRLERAKHRIEMLTGEVDEYYAHFRVIDRPDRTAQPAAMRRTDRALGAGRKESRGLHYTLDYPELLPEARDTVLVP